jgi:hypothetical protein
LAAEADDVEFDVELDVEFDAAPDSEPVVADGAVEGFGGAAGEEGAEGALPDAGDMVQQGGLGAETPAMPEPRPSFCKLVASSLPLASRPFAD